VFHASDHFGDPPLDSLQQVPIFPVLRAPELDAGIHSWMQDSRWGVTRAEGHNHLPPPAGHVSFGAAQDVVGFLGCKHTLLGHVALLVNQHPQVLLARAALNPCFTQPVFVLGLALIHVQDLALGLVKLPEVRMGPLLKSVQVPLDGIPFLRHVDRTTQLGVLGKAAEGALNPAILVADTDVKQHWSKY